MDAGSQWLLACMQVGMNVGIGYRIRTETRMGGKTGVEEVEVEGYRRIWGGAGRRAGEEDKQKQILFEKSIMKPNVLSTN